MNSEWKSQCSLQTLKQRAFLLSKIREYFTSQNVLEVETPILSSSGNTDINIESFTSENIKNDQDKSYLRTSPEFSLKRLLCGGIGDVYEIGKVFRKGEVSKTHNVEFTMLEWYRIDYSYNKLIQDVTRLFESIMSAFRMPIADTCIVSYKQAFNQYLSLDIDQISITKINSLCNGHGYSGSKLSKDEGLDFLFATQVQPKLNKQAVTFLTLYPASQAALSKINPNDKTTSLRFEVFYQGHELGNGYQELTDAKEQEKRFNQDNVNRVANKQEQVIVDKNLISAMENGMPNCSGIAIGIDRLLMAILGKSLISDVITYEADKA